jgi:hypothetical protein
LKVSFGRYHTPINWWNTAFHHGQWLQTTISRPEIMQFGGRFIPVHFVGALVEGGVPAGGLNLNYQAGIGNGRGNVISRGGDAGDNNARPAYVFNAFAKPDQAFGLQVGGSFYLDRISQPGLYFASGLFRRHVRDCADRRTPTGGMLIDGRDIRRARKGRARRSQLREAEVEHLGLAAFGHDDVGWLDVAVDDAGGVRRVERVGNFDREIDKTIDRHGLSSISSFSVRPCSSSRTRNGRPS